MKRYYMVGYVNELTGVQGFGSGFVLCEWNGYPGLQALKNKIKDMTENCVSVSVLSIVELKIEDYEQLKQECSVIYAGDIP